MYMPHFMGMQKRHVASYTTLPEVIKASSGSDCGLNSLTSFLVPLLSVGSFSLLFSESIGAMVARWRYGWMTTAACPAGGGGKSSSSL